MLLFVISIHPCFHASILQQIAGQFVGIDFKTNFRYNTKTYISFFCKKLYVLSCMYNEKNRYALHIFVIKKTRKYLCKIKNIRERKWLENFH